MASRLRIMTYNVHGCVGLDRRLDVGRVAEVIAREDPDVVALQELDVGRVRSGGVDQAHEIAARLGMAHHFNAAFRVAEEQYGDAILSRLPMRLAKTGALPRPSRVPGLELRGALWAEVACAGGAALQVVNTHLGLVPLEQKGQVDALLGPDWCGSPAFRAGPALLLGDFNAGSRYAAYKRLAGELSDLQKRFAAPTVATFPSRLPMLRIDHLFACGAVRPLDVWAPNTATARIASDHLPLAADVEVGG
jgi:endonuclease/exonuclease/phosphatase family metal-dependent hydrolase